MRFGAKLLLVGALMVLAGSVFHLNYATNVAYPYRMEVSSHIENAYGVQTPEELIQEVELAVEGMRGLSLQDHMSMAYFWWDKLPSNSMAFQYEYLDQILIRAEAVIEWRDTEFAEAGGREQFQDLYQAKMGSLKDMLRRGYDYHLGADWIAADAYLLAFHKAYYVGFLLTIPLLVGGTLLMLVGLAVAAWYPSKKKWRDFFVPEYDDEDRVFLSVLFWGLAVFLALLPMGMAIVMAAFA